MSRKIRVLVIDDSASVRQTLVSVIEQDPGIEVMGVAADPFVAARRIQDEVPDVITLDVEMPRMDGITFLRKLMAQHPIPVVMCSSLTEHGSDTLIQAMEAGAVDVITKPRIAAADHLDEIGERIRSVIRAAAQVNPARLRRIRATAGRVPADKLTADAVLPPARSNAMLETTEKVICIGASTGGTESLREVLVALPANAPGILIVQHMPERFTAAFARRLNSLCQIEVREAVHGDAVLRGCALIAPGDHHLLLERRGARYHVAVRQGPLVSRHRPSVDVLFRSAARAAGANAVGVIMTGMGDDGARGLEEMKAAGAHTIAQDEATSIVFGMPREAIARGAAARILALDQIGAEVMHATRSW